METINIGRGTLFDEKLLNLLILIIKTGKETKGLGSERRISQCEKDLLITYVLIKKYSG